MKFNYVMMHIVTILALISIGGHVYQGDGFNSIIWQITTIIWVLIARMYLKTIEKYERNN